MLDRDKWYLTEHALGRALDMQLTPEMIEGVLERPDYVRGSRTYPDMHNHRLGPVTAAVSLNDIPHRVVTFVWSDPDMWDRDFEKFGYEDRQHRDRADFGKRLCHT